MIITNYYSMCFFIFQEVIADSCRFFVMGRKFFYM
jgi:hypothetical protein